jgi:hypothetical protein
MILTVFVLFGIIGLALVALGYSTHTSVFSLLGFVTLFFISLSLVGGRLEIPDGEMVAYSYQCRACNETRLVVNNETNRTSEEFSYLSNVTAVVSSTQTIPLYDELDEMVYRRLGYFFAIMSFAGIMTVWFQYRSEKGMKKTDGDP